MKLWQKCLAEFIGTAVLVIFGCGTAMLVGCNAAQGSGYLLTALAFGLVIVGMAYCVGNVSGCHINPAVSLGALLSKRMSTKDFVAYIISQCVGAIIGAAILNLIFTTGGLTDMTGGLGSNGIGSLNNNIAAGIIVEIILTCVFVLTILGVTSPKANHGSFGGLIIGLTLTLVHIFGIGLTGTSVNPARSLGPALIALFNGNSAPISVLWIFIVAPLIGSALAAIIYGLIDTSKES